MSSAGDARDVSTRSKQSAWHKYGCAEGGLEAEEAAIGFCGGAGAGGDLEEQGRDEEVAKHWDLDT